MRSYKTFGYASTTSVPKNDRCAVVRILGKCGDYQRAHKLWVGAQSLAEFPLSFTARQINWKL